MQFQKNDIKKVILREAREEFMEKGFKDASMRTIAKSAGVTLSNIYNYFRNKNEIFCDVLSGLLCAIDSTMEKHNSPDYISTDIFSSEEYLRSQIDMFVGLVENYKEDFIREYMEFGTAGWKKVMRVTG
jgi:AcrR family transcriptional regulator